MLKKFLSRKFLIILLTGLCNILIATGQIPPEVKDLLLKLITALGTAYVAIEGIADIISRIKKAVGVN